MHWHHVLVERKDTGETVQLGTFLSSDRYETKKAAANDVGRLLADLTEVEEAALRSAKEALISSEEGVKLAAWARVHASRELHLVECPDDACDETIGVFRAALEARIQAETGKPVSPSPPPQVGYL